VTEHLYVGTRDGLVKIGISVNPMRRMRGQRLHVLFVAPLERAPWFEYEVCRVLRRHRLPGKVEWFDIEPEVALRVVRRVLARSRYYPDTAEAIRLLRDDTPIPEVAAAIGVSKSLIYQRARGDWAHRIAAGAGGK